ncbi:iron permease FTR1 [Aspergillus ellipticus CBS 707.79]|uniref:Iron permease FTR1 n=1 Tax=Aspergillus ellipticus CBS 707.79 TaxID=1448320 RepID=A0A319CUG8_9EURO|nr:iron permease FTR1 [Aspergillus ellipticus CBS 707.79]
MGNNPVFAVTVFFICFRECLETSVVVSVLLAFLKQSLGRGEDQQTYKRLVKQVWLGCALGLFLCLCVGAGMIGAFYGLGTDTFSSTEDIWEGVLGILASIIIAIMGAALLRVSKLQEKWRLKLTKALQHHNPSNGPQQGRVKRFFEKYVMFILPFITVLREGLEAVVYVGGVGLGLPATSFPLAVVCGILAGCLVGYLIFRGGSETSMQIFLIISTCFLYLVAAGLFSRGVWYFENNAWNNIIGGDASETGSGPGSYDIRKSVWHVNCCNPELGGGGGWGIFNALLGWTNSADYGSVISYNLYWICVMLAYAAMLYRERKGAIPVIDPMLARYKAFKARVKATILRRPIEDDSAPVEPLGVLQSSETKEKAAGAGFSTSVREAEA